MSQPQDLCKPHYFLTHSVFGTKEVTKEQFIAEERRHGFYPKSGRPDDCATGGFGSGGPGFSVGGSIRYLAPSEVSQGDGYVLDGYRYELPKNGDESAKATHPRFAWISAADYDEHQQDMTESEKQLLVPVYVKAC